MIFNKENGFVIFFFVGFVSCWNDVSKVVDGFKVFFIKVIFIVR